MTTIHPKPVDRLRDYAEKFCRDTEWHRQPEKKIPALLAMAILRLAAGLPVADERRKALEAIAQAVAQRCQAA
jgi:hypothetical protein